MENCKDRSSSKGVIRTILLRYIDGTASREVTFVNLVLSLKLSKEILKAALVSLESANL